MEEKLTEEDVIRYLEECNESQDILGFCYIPEMVCSKILDLYQKEKEKNKELEERNTDLLLKLEMKKLLFVRKDKTTNKLLSELYIRKDELEEDYIPKSKVKELINKRGNNGYTSLDCIEDIEELLEERN